MTYSLPSCDIGNKQTEPERQAQMETNTEKEWFTTDELIRWLGLGRTKTYELLRSGDIPSYRIGRVRRIRHRDIEDWLEKNRSHPRTG